MGATIRTLLDENDDFIYPKTKTVAVYDENDNTLDEVLTPFIRGKNEQGITPIVDPILHESDIEQTPSTSTTKLVSSNVIKGISDDVSEIETNLGNPSSASSVTGADAFSKISTLNSDLTPQSFTLTIDTAHFSMPSYRAIKMGKFVEIAGDIAVTDNSYKTSNNFSQCFNIPEVSKAPSVATVFNIIDTTNDKPLNGTITTDGKVYVNRDYTTSCSSLRFHALYIVS